MHLFVEDVEIRGGRLKVSGWGFSKQSPVKSVVLRLCYGDAVRSFPLLTGRERADVYQYFGQNKYALLSGFMGVVPLNGSAPDSIFIELQPSSGAPLSARVHPRFVRVSLNDSLIILLHAMNGQRVKRGIGWLLKGNWGLLLRQLRRIIENSHKETITEVQLKLSLELLAVGPSPTFFFEVPVDIIIPVYNGFEYLQTLFNSLERNTTAPYRLIVVDDASPDTRIIPLLSRLLQRHSHAILLRNDSNIGFVGTVNKAASLTRGDFVLLNTDIELPPHWLERLIAPIIHDRKIASTTPFSNAATICSFPEINKDNPILGGFSVEQIDRWFRLLREDLAEIVLPTGIGFCMGVNGDIWHDIGPFDEKTFGRGYGEENDWCQRAAMAGYRNIAVPNLFVYHKHGGSFKNASRSSLRLANLKKLQAHWPNYDGDVAAFIEADPLLIFRQLLTLLIICGESRIAPVLVVDHAIGGGANVYRKKLVDDRLALNQPVLLLTRKNGNGLSPDFCLLSFFFQEHSLNFSIADCLVLENFFKYIPLGEIFYNNAVSYERPLHLVRLLASLKIMTGARMIAVFHDFYPLCPSYTLLDTNSIYHGISKIENVWDNIDGNRFSRNPQHNTMEEWLSTWGMLLSEADELICFSDNSRQHVECVYPQCASRIVVRPHTLTTAFSRKPVLIYNARLHVGVVGSIGYPKGAGIVANLARALQQTDADAKVTVIGMLENAPHLTNLHVTGPYHPEELPDLLERYGINVCLLPSIWPETFSYVAEELMALEMPLVCFDLGAPSDRVARYPFGRVAPQVSAESAMATLKALHHDVQRQSTL